MKKCINSYHELIEWCESILLDDDLMSKVSCPKVSFYFSLSAFEIQGELGVNYFDINNLPPIIKKADSLCLYAKDSMLMFKAHYQAE